MKTPHLGAALLAIALAAAALAAGHRYARDVESSYIAAPAPLVFEQKVEGVALQAEAFRQPDLLPMYGSWELRAPMPYHPSSLFREYPTGFTVFPVGKPGNTCGTILHKLAAVGPVLRGRKVVLCVSPSWFLAKAVAPTAYAGNFSRLHAGAPVFDDGRGLAFRQEAAGRMVRHPEALANDPLLRFAVVKLADLDPVSTLLYHVAFPLGKLQVLVLRLRDQWATVKFLRARDDLRARVPRLKAVLDWGSLRSSAERGGRADADNNPFGFDNRPRSETSRDRWPALEGSSSDRAFIREVGSAGEWDDLDLLLRFLRGRGALPFDPEHPHGRGVLRPPGRLRPGPLGLPRDAPPGRGRLRRPGPRFRRSRRRRRFLARPFRASQPEGVALVRRGARCV